MYNSLDTFYEISDNKNWKYYKSYKDHNPWINPTNPCTKDTLICLNCGHDTGISKVLHMVIPAEGLRCPHCGTVVIAGPTQYCC